MKEYDVIVIGGGGGTKLVRPCAELGKKVAIIEKEKLGGTCLNRGCIPSKMLIHVADIISMAKESEKLGLKFKGHSINFEKLTTRVSNTIDKESDSISPGYESHPNIDLYTDHAQFIKSSVIAVGDQKIKGKKIFVATGADAKIPPIPGLQGTPYMTYRQALRSKKQPKKMIVIGGGYIAVELGYFYAALGTDVTFLIRSGLIRNEDKEIQEAFKESFTKQFNCKLGLDFESVSHEKDQFTVKYSDSDGKKHSISADALFVAAGVKPNTHELGLENTKIKLDKRGFIEVDNYLKTAEENVWALGDCIGRNLFRHAVNFEGEYLFNELYKKDKARPITYSPMPHAIFTHPQVGGVGLTEEQVIEKKIPYFKGVNFYKNSAMGMALMSDEGFVKLLFHKESHKLIGAHIIGEEASNMIHMLIAYMNMNAKLEDILSTIFIHPAINEIVRNAARSAQKNMEGNLKS